MSTAARAKLVLVGDAHQLAPVKARGGMFEQLCDELPWTQRLSEVWRMRDHRGTPRLPGAAQRPRQPAPQSGRLVPQPRPAAHRRCGRDGRRRHHRLHHRPRRRQRRRDHLRPLGNHRRDQPETAPPLPRRPRRTDCARLRAITRSRAGDIILSRNNDASIAVAPGPDHRRGDRIDQVRNGNRWRVAWVDADAGQIAAERLTDSARVIFEGDYRREHVTLGYATTVHAAQGMTVGDDRTPGCAGPCCRTALLARWPTSG